ncbi:MAG TPA: metallophosphoesterase family protein [Candidatus Omnitrophota bacterium]|nr:metallophosphoesterase family protein [Candidatus Omnitrophota bacterium]
MRILVLSDTHIPRTSNDLPKKIYDEIRGADMIFHAGDFVEKGLYEKLSALKTIVAVHGNMDSSALQQQLKAKEVIAVEGVKIGLIHGFGPARDLIDTVRKEFKDVDAIVFGHSHSATNTVKDGVLFFNPGTATDRVFATTNTYGILEVDGKNIKGSIIQLE